MCMLNYKALPYSRSLGERWLAEIRVSCDYLSRFDDKYKHRRVDKYHIKSIRDFGNHSMSCLLWQPINRDIV